MTNPKIAVTYNPVVGGTVLSLRSVIADLETEVVDCDYRKIFPPTDNLEQIYTDRANMIALFKKAKQNAKAFLGNVDCLVVSGNPAMVDPKLFGDQSSGERIDLARAIAELGLIHVAMQSGMPILAICGGNQILNVYLGGKIRDLSAKDLQKQGVIHYDKIDIDAHSELAQILEPKHTAYSDEDVIADFFCYHFQVVSEIGGKGMIRNQDDYLKVVGRAGDSNGTIEAVEAQFGAPVMGLQFHPEVAIKGLEIPQLTQRNLSGDVYKAPSMEIMLKNKKIFEAFRQSAESFKNKKMINAEIRANHAIANSDDTLKNGNTLLRELAVRPRVKEHLQTSPLSLNRSPVSTPFQPELVKDNECEIENITNQAIENRVQFLKAKSLQRHYSSVNVLSLQNVFSKIPATMDCAKDRVKTKFNRDSMSEPKMNRAR